MPWSAAAIVGGAFIASEATKGAAGEQADATRDSSATQKYMYDQTRADNAPALESRNWALNELRSKLSSPNLDVSNEAGYKFGLDQGLKSLNNQLTARGMRNSGAALKAANQFGTDYATTKYDAAYNRIINPLQSLAGLSQSGANSIAAAGNNYANNVSANTTAMGNALGASSLAQGNIWGNALNQAGSTMKNWWNSPSTDYGKDQYGTRFTNEDVMYN